MDKQQFNAVLPIFCSALIEKIVAELNISVQEAITQLYSSQLYELLELEETKVWQYSTEKLFELFQEEKTSGKMEFPQI